MNTRNNRIRSVPVWAATISLILVFLVALSEFGARVIWSLRGRRYDVGSLHEYQTLDSRHPGNWLLKPGFKETLRESLEIQRKSGRVIGLATLEQQASTRGLQPDDLVLEINSDGFRGGEIDKSHSRVRILAIGDSCTFGLMGERPYARVFQEQLEQSGNPVEVINGAVEGYSPRNALYRMAQFKALKPELTTVYIGWNALYADEDGANPSGLKSIALLRLAHRKFEIWRQGRQGYALKDYSKKKNPDKASPQVARLKHYLPSFMPQVEQIINELESIGSIPVIITLPCLYVTDEVPTQKALELGHLPLFTDNPYALAIMAERYNEELRGLAKRRSLRLIDLEQWSRTAIQPRDKYFIDSVHLTAEGQRMIGEYVATQLLPEVARQVEKFKSSGVARQPASAASGKPKSSTPHY